MNCKREMFFFEWVIFDNCNLNCSYCVNKGEFSQKPTSKMSYIAGLETDIANKIVELSNNAERVVVNLTGGDPLLADHFVEVLAILANAPNITVNVITNLKRIDAVAEDIIRIMPAITIGGSLHVQFRSAQEIEQLIDFLNRYKSKLNISLSQVNHNLSFENIKTVTRITEQTGLDVMYQTFIPPWTDAGKVENEQSIRDANFVSSLGKRCCLGYSHFFLFPDGKFQYNLWCNDDTRKVGDFLRISPSNFDEFILNDMKRCPRTSCGCNYNVISYPEYSSACNRLGYTANEVFGPDNLRQPESNNKQTYSQRFRLTLSKLLKKTRVSILCR